VCHLLVKGGCDSGLCVCLIVQVREIAAASISGLIRCGFIKSVPKLQVSENVGSTVDPLISKHHGTRGCSGMQKYYIFN